MADANFHDSNTLTILALTFSTDVKGGRLYKNKLLDFLIGKTVEHVSFSFSLEFNLYIYEGHSINKLKFSV